MATTEEFVAALNQVRERAEGLRASIIAAPDTHLLGEHTWTVRDALCHLAARSHLSMMVDLVTQMANGPQSPRPPGFNPDDVNQAQIDERQGRSAESLLDEIINEHSNAIAMVPTLDQDLLQRSVPDIRTGGEIVISDLLMGGTARHDNVHLEDIEQALKS